MTPFGGTFGVLDPFEYVFILFSMSGHVLVEIALVGFIFYMLFKGSYKVAHTSRVALTKSEIEELISDWRPEPLVDPKAIEEIEHIYIGSSGAECVPTLCSAADTNVSLCEGDSALSYTNFVSSGFLNYQNHPEVIDAALKALAIYGIGSCGPRGFYGTTAAHLELEAVIASFMGSEDAVVYSSGLTTITSLVPTFAKFNDYLFVDKGASFPIQNAIHCSRALNVYWFEHNNSADLLRLISSMPHVFDGKNRVFVIVEGLYANTGAVCCLPEILKIKQRFPFRIVLEESYSLGVLGSHGRGVTEHYHLPSTCVEFIVASLGNAVGCLGGFSVGTKQITSYQRLNSSGYVFSCSPPPYIVGAAIKSFELMERGERISQLQKNAAHLYEALNAHMHSLDVLHSIHSPTAHLKLTRSARSKLEEERLLQEIVNLTKSERILVSRSFHLKRELLSSPSIFLNVTAKHTKEDIDRAVRTLEKQASSVLLEDNST